MEIPSGLAPERLLGFLEKPKRTIVVTALKQGATVPLHDLVGVIREANEWYFDRFDNGEGDAELSHLGWTGYTLGRHVERTLGRASALPFYADSYRTFNHLEAKGRDIECKQILEQYPEIEAMVRGSPV